MTAADSRSKHPRHKRRLPGSPDSRLLTARPTTFVGWWAWGVGQAEAATPTAPLAIHSRGGDRDDWGAGDASAIRALPFARKFEQHVDRPKTDQPRFSNSFIDHMERKPLKSLMRSAMLKLYSQRSRAQSHEFRIIFALLNGHTDPEIVRLVALGGPRRDYFEATAIRALEFVWQKAQESLRTVVDPPAPAGAA